MLRERVTLVVVALLLVLAWPRASSSQPQAGQRSTKSSQAKSAQKRLRSDAVPAADRSAGLAAWQQVYSVLSHPRCVNCHTATGYPQQGDDRHRHLFNVVRGGVNHGVPGLNCATCHQSANADSTGVPGAPDWHLAPLAMAWQDKHDKILPSAAVCRAVTDRSRNENMDGPALLKHHTEAPIVLWSFQPGRRNDGTPRTLPPLTHEQFVAATRRWVDAGTPCP
jgi:mono/diheme cytochrome c family protein